MAFVPNFSLTQNISTPSIITATDTSTGTPAITDRIIYLQIFNGTYLVGTGVTTTFNDFPVASSSVNLTVMTKDYSVLATVVWLNGSSIVGTKTNPLYEFNAYARTYRAKLFKAQSSNPALVNSANFFNVESNITTFIDCGNEAVALMNDITLAQFGNDNAAYYINNPGLAY